MFAGVSPAVQTTPLILADATAPNTTYIAKYNIALYNPFRSGYFWFPLSALAPTFARGRGGQRSRFEHTHGARSNGLGVPLTYQHFPFFGTAQSNI